MNVTSPVGRPTLRSLLAAALALIIASRTFGGGAGPADDTSSDVTFTDLSVDQVVLVERVIDAFEEAELDLPPIDVIGHRYVHACSGRHGAHHVSNGRSVIDLCARRPKQTEEFLILHEVAHAWDQHSLTPERRQRFLELRGLEAWRTDDPERWVEHGSEHAAEIIAWGLVDRPVRLLRIDNNGCSDLLAGYRVLTGTDPLHGLTDACLVDGP
jgi:hypothetical protein